MKVPKVNKDTIVKATLFVVLPLVLTLVLFYVYRKYYFGSEFVNKVLLKKDMEFKFFTYDEFDSREHTDNELPTYFRNGYYYITDSGKDNMNLDTIKKLDLARLSIENGYNKINPSKRIVFKINSAYRTDERNSEVGGVLNSAHRNKNGSGAKAVDISWKNYDKEQRQAILDALRDAGFNRIGKANTFIHADNDSSLPNPATWKYSGYNNLV